MPVTLSYWTLCTDVSLMRYQYTGKYPTRNMLMFLGWNLKMSCNWNWSDQVWWFWLETVFGMVGSSEIGAGSLGRMEQVFLSKWQGDLPTHQLGPQGWGSYGKWHHQAEWVEVQRPGTAVLPCQWFEQCCCWRNRWRRKGIPWGLVLAVSHLEIRKAGGRRHTCFRIGFLEYPPHQTLYLDGPGRPRRMRERNQC